VLETPRKVGAAVGARAVRLAVLNHVPWREHEHSAGRQGDLGQGIRLGMMMTRSAQDER
jgi:hypothetical protein